MVMQKHWAMLAATVLAGLLAGGCAWSRTKINDENAYVKAQAVQPGRTTAAQLEAIMGSAPNTVMPMKGNRQVFIYNFGDSKTKACNLLIVNFSKTNARLDSAYFVIGENNVVEHKSVSNNSQQVPWEWAPFGN